MKNLNTINRLTLAWIVLLILSCNSFKLAENAEASSLRIEKDLKVIVNTKYPRNYKNITSLNYVANYINNEFQKVCDSVRFQKYSINNNEYKNVIGSIGTNYKERIIIGAHYDVYGDSDGADDNASGVVGLLELARLLSNEKLKYRIDFVAYTLEESPFFRTKNMGSYKHAKFLYDSNINIKGMICLESIGYYDDSMNSQNFPVKEMRDIYGVVGNFITVVQNKKNEKFSIEISNLMLNQKLIETKSFMGSSDLPGVDFSDHMNYWEFNFEAVMITNTAFYRNKNYHTNKDVLGTLNIKKMDLVIRQIHGTILNVE